MPIVAFALAAYLAGLLAGFSGSLNLEFLTIAAAGIVGHLRGGRLSFAFAALAVAGMVAARDTARHDAQCADATTGASAVAVVVADSVAPGAFVRGRLASCDEWAS